jgi:hypothetical protein
MGTRRATVRLRYGRMATGLASMGVTTVAVLGGTGVLPSAAEAPTRPEPGIVPAAAQQRPTEPDAGRRQGAADRRPVVTPDSTPAERVVTSELLPADSGTGRRVVFSESRQRVWLVGWSGAVRRTYLVSGSLHDNLDPGTYSVYSRSMNAVGVDDSGTMKYFVRFTQGDTGAAIGFHDIPVDDGERVQSVAELGEPTSHGCIRQRTADARAMWGFARLGTAVVVTP